MSNQNEFFAPIGKLVSTSTKLEFEYHDRQFLQREITETANALETTLDIVPDQISAVYDHYRVGKTDQRKEKREPQPEIGIHYSETKEGLLSATLGLTDAQGDPTRFVLNPAANLWEQYIPDINEPVHYHNHAELAFAIGKHFDDDNELMAPLMDLHYSMTPADITHLLARHIETHAKTRSTIKRFSDNKVILGQDYASNAEASLMLKEENGRKTHQLGQKALYQIGGASIMKEYIYQFGPKPSERDGGLAKAQSKSGISKQSLDNFLRLDQEASYPLDTLHAGLAQLRTGYDLSEDIKIA